MVKIHEFNINDDLWVMPSSPDLSPYSFYFDFFPNEAFKVQVKRFMLDNLNSRRIKVATLHRYSYSLRHFFTFLINENINIENFGQVTHEIIERFAMYLLSNKDKPSTRNLAMVSLKVVIQHGQRFEYENYPARNVFDGKEYRVLKTEDNLKTQYIPTSVMDQIESAIKKERNEKTPNHILINLLIILIDTGMRISEALSLEESNLIEDFQGKPVLHIESRKTDSVQHIPVSERVRKAFENQVYLSRDQRIAISSNKIFLFTNRAMKVQVWNQKAVRYYLDQFTSKYHIALNGRSYKIIPHAFRHTLGMKMLNSGMTFLEVQNHLGHESSHSTAHYAKVLSSEVSKEMKKAGIIGMVVKEISKETVSKHANLDNEILLSASLPDGVCKKPITGEGKLCKKFNMCLFCPKFITTPEFLPEHRNHLTRIQDNKSRYMQENYIGTDVHLAQIEDILSEIIKQLEVLQDDKE